MCVGGCLRFESKVLLEFSAKILLWCTCHATAPCPTTQRLRVAGSTLVPNIKSYATAEAGKVHRTCGLHEKVTESIGCGGLFYIKRAVRFAGLLTNSSIWVVVKIMVPFLGPYYKTAPNI